MIWMRVCTKLFQVKSTVFSRHSSPRNGFANGIQISYLARFFSSSTLVFALACIIIAHSFLGERFLGLSDKTMLRLVGFFEKCQTTRHSILSLHLLHQTGIWGYLNISSIFANDLMTSKIGRPTLLWTLERTQVRMKWNLNNETFLRYRERWIN